ncbi:MAG: magnesium transporter [Candidatus Buchananbacteria bacterium CG10_big_fil_rev_8_21_14_0_10_42_9]|uniref:Magnesium transporter MgtE n=1 Tax=Candidatus Buchananbacteria bacterium CG10_big_fil_rev_8_21_14_0_10_42_9 TaxID=1974526 RepID=A0A2H0VZV9_9BACT|nr:MAG: magnesium transporter [Candidatus Buchananbacteria bacterium CG10_big_fil_rev_8_21_14_0_10_42_9]
MNEVTIPQQDFDITLNEVDELLNQKDYDTLEANLVQCDVSLLVDIIDGIIDGRKKIFSLLPPERQANLILKLSENSQDEILSALSNEALARIIRFMEDDNATDLIQLLPSDRTEGILAALSPRKRTRVSQLLKFDPDTAGGIMDMYFIQVKPSETVEAVRKKVHEYQKEHGGFPRVLIEDAQGNIAGYAPTRKLIGEPGKTEIARLSRPAIYVSYDEDQEVVLNKALEHNFTGIVVTDEQNKVVGVIRQQDFLKVAQEEATEDILHLSGLSKEENLLDSPLLALRRRYGWLLIHLIMTSMAASLVTLFHGTLAGFVILAAYLPIIGGTGRNVSTQSFAVVVRAMSLGEMDLKIGGKVLLKEIRVGLMIGILHGIILAAISYIFTQNIMLSLVLFLTMSVLLLIAGFLGSIIPITLRQLKFDPAISSTVFITTLADAFGYLIFLSLAHFLLV